MRLRTIRWIAACLLIAGSAGCSSEHAPRDASFTNTLLEDVVGQAFERTTPLVGRQAPDFDLPLLGAASGREGKSSLSLTDVSDRIVMIDFWNSGCVPCIEEHATLVQVYRQFRDQGVLFIGITRDSESSFQRFEEQHGPFDYPVVRENGSTMAAYLAPGWPTKVIIDDSGRVVWYRFGGPITKEDLTTALEDVLSSS